jgi:hypothetical protein
MKLLRRVAVICMGGIGLGLTGCSTSFTPSTNLAAAQGATIQGKTFGGQQPITGMKVYLYAAGAGGYGTAATSLLTSAANTAYDGTNYYVTTDENGFFAIGGDYSCPAGSTSYLYLYGVGGDAGGGTNAKIAMMAPLGACAAGGDLAVSVPYVWMNEVTTVVTAYSLAGWMTSPLNLATDDSTPALGGLALAFTTATRMEDIATGTAYSALPTIAGASGQLTGTVPQSTINSLANMLAACVNSGSTNASGCTGLFNLALSGGATGTTPANTAEAIINIAHHPTANIAALFDLLAPTPPFQPALNDQPSDWTLSLQETIPVGASAATQFLAVDGNGNIAEIQGGSGQYQFFGPDGTAIKLGSDSSTAGMGFAGRPVFDSSHNLVWAQWNALPLFGDINVYNATGSLLGDCGLLQVITSSFPFPLRTPTPDTQGMAYDHNGLFWAVSGSQNTIYQIGLPLQSCNGFTNGYTAGLSTPVDLAADGLGNLWVANNGAANVLRFTSSGTPTAFGSSLSGQKNIAVGANNEAVVSGGATTLTAISSGGTVTSECTGGTKEVVAIDGANVRWVSTTANTLEFCAPGAANATTLGGPLSATGLHWVTVDAAGNVLALGQPMVEVVGAATPPTLPLSTATANNALGRRP